MSLFETILAHRGHPMFLDEHLSRLAESCHTAGFPRPLILAEQIREVIDSCEALKAGGVLRLYVTAGAGSPSDPVVSPSVFLLADPHLPPQPGDPLRLRLHPWPLVRFMPGTKTGNYWPNIQALQWASSAGCDECIVMAQDGRITGCATASLFLLIDDKWVTPRVEDGARDGVTRQWVKERLHVLERAVFPAEFGSIRAVFISNSRIGPLAAGELDARALDFHATPLGLAALWAEELENFER